MIVQDISDVDATIRSLVENVQRGDLSLEERVEAYRATRRYGSQSVSVKPVDWQGLRDGEAQALPGTTKPMKRYGFSGHAALKSDEVCLQQIPSAGPEEQYLSRMRHS